MTDPTDPSSDIFEPQIRKPKKEASVSDLMNKYGSQDFHKKFMGSSKLGTTFSNLNDRGNPISLN